jgi:CubicO group peptidase (beta-lactamase class C family)
VFRTVRVLALLTVAPLGAQSVVVAPAARAADSILTAAAARGFAGVGLIMKDGAPILRKGYGLAQRETRTAFTPATIVQVGSNTKDFTTVAILQFMSRGKIEPADPMSKFFPDIPADKRGITIRQLLDHRSGLPIGVGRDPELVTRDEFRRRVFALPLGSAPGEKEQYSNAGFSLLALIIEQLSGQSYDEYVRDNILTPAGLTRTGYLLPKFDRAQVAHGYASDGDKGTILDFAHPADGPSWTLRGNGGMLSSVDDMATFYRVLFTTEKLLPAEFRNRRFDPNDATVLAGSDLTSYFVFQHEPQAKLDLILASVTTVERAPALLRAIAPTLGIGGDRGNIVTSIDTASAPISLPTTPAGRTIREYLDMYNKADSADAERFWRERATPRADGPPPAVRAGRSMDMHRELGRITPVGYTVQADGRVELKARGANGDIAVIMFDIEPEAPHRIRGLGIRVGG